MTSSERKLSLSPHTDSEYPSSLSSSDSENYSEVRLRSHILEVSGMNSALESVVCKECQGAISFKEDLANREGLCTHPYLFCCCCQNKTVIPFAKCGVKSLAVNRRSVLANKCVGGAIHHSKLSLFFLTFHLLCPSIHTENI